MPVTEEKKEENRNSLLFKSGCSHLLHQDPGSVLFFVPQDLNLYVHISKDLGCGYPEYPRLWYDMLGVQECWVLLLGEGTVFSPGQTPV